MRMPVIIFSMKATYFLLCFIFFTKLNLRLDIGHSRGTPEGVKISPRSIWLEYEMDEIAARLSIFETASMLNMKKYIKMHDRSECEADRCFVHGIADIKAKISKIVFTL